MNRTGISKQIMQISITSFDGILVKLPTSRLAIKWSGQKLETSSSNENVTCTENSLTARGDKIRTENLANV